MTPPHRVYPCAFQVRAVLQPARGTRTEEALFGSLDNADTLAEKLRAAGPPFDQMLPVEGSVPTSVSRD